MSLVTQAERDLLEFRHFHTQKAAAELLHTYACRPDADPEILIKIVNSKSADIAKVIPEKKADPNAGLATFNITFVNGAMKAEPSSASLELVDEVRRDLEVFDLAQALLPPGFAPSAQMQAMSGINADLGGLDD